MFYEVENNTIASYLSCRSLVKNQESFAFVFTVEKFKAYRRYYKELSPEFIQTECKRAMDKHFASKGLLHDIVDMNIFTKAFHKSYRHKYAQMRMSEAFNTTEI
jgi:hypothetical protein